MLDIAEAALKENAARLRLDVQAGPVPRPLIPRPPALASPGSRGVRALPSRPELDGLEAADSGGCACDGLAAIRDPYFTLGRAPGYIYPVNSPQFTLG